MFWKLGNVEKCSENIYPAPNLSNKCYSEFPTIPIYQTLGSGEWEFWEMDCGFYIKYQANLATPITKT